MHQMFLNAVCWYQTAAEGIKGRGATAAPHHASKEIHSPTCLLFTFLIAFKQSLCSGAGQVSIIHLQWEYLSPKISSLLNFTNYSALCYLSPNWSPNSGSG